MISIDWLVILLFAGAAQCLLLGALILVIKTGDRQANIFLSIFFVLVAIRQFMRFALYGGSPLYLPLYGLNILPMMAPPVLYLYVSALVDLRFRISGRLAWHLLVMAPALFYFGYQYYVYDDVAQLSGLDTYRQAHLLLHVTALLATLGYGILALRKLAQHRLKIELVYSRIENVSLTWLIWLIRIYITVIVMHFSAVLLERAGLVGYESRTWLFLLSSLLVVYVVSLGGLRQPVVFTRSVRELMIDLQQDRPRETGPEKQLGPAQDRALREDLMVQSPQSKKSGLDDEHIQIIWERLQQVMEEKQPYLDNELNLAGLASLSSITASQLSRVINARAGVNFYEFVNGYRIKAALKLLTEPEKKEQNMLDTAMAVGFNSQSTFYSHFKKRVGMTPKQFQNLHGG